MEKFSKDCYDGLFTVGDVIYGDIMRQVPYIVRSVTDEHYIVERAERYTLDEILTKARKSTQSGAAKTIHAIVGDICDKMSIDELKEFFCTEILGGENLLRYYITEQITGAVINRIRYEK